MANQDGEARVGEIVQELQAATLGGHAVAAVLPRMRRLLDADRVAAHKLVRTATGYKPEFVFLEGFQVGAERLFEQWVTTAPADAFGYDPSAPEEAQRNLVVRTRSSMAADQVARLPVVRELFPKLGLAGMDQIRVLVCDGPKLLAWVGAFRQRSFTDDEERWLQKLVPAMHSRLMLEATLLR